MKKGLFLVLLLFPFATLAAENRSNSSVAGFSKEEALRLGERMFRQGILPSGEPMQAVVQRDIPVEGTMFSCQTCHLRSGLGSIEGTIITLPVNGAKLYRTLHVGAEVETKPARSQLAKSFQGGDIRPAYTDETLARAIWFGENPGGRELDWTMPRYLLDDRDMEILVFYLKNLSSEISPGVNDTTIRFATVVAEGVPREDREAMQTTLEAYIKDHNAQSRHQESRARKGPFYRQDKYTAYRRFALDVWELKGPPETWRSQLETYYRQGPVFALLGGIVTGDWAPVHGFCEERKVPCLFPITDFPVISEKDWYTLYFSKGLYQEGEAAARYLPGLAEIPKNASFVQVYREDRKSLMLARGFRETREKLGQAPVEDLMLKGEDAVTEDFWKRLADRYPRAVFLLWLGPKDFQAADQLAAGEEKSKRMVLSSSLLEQEVYAIPENIRNLAYITWPYRLPREEENFQKVVRRWLQIRGIPVTNLRIQSKIYFLGWMLAGSIQMMGDDYYRDYFLDVIDMMRDETYAIAAYPRVSFGPGQRYAAKGCYVVRLSGGTEPLLAAVSNWVVH